MTWTTTDFPPEMKYLPVNVRNRAIEIANSLLKETLMKERVVIKAAISRARQLSSKDEKKRDVGLKARGNGSSDQFKDLSVVPYDNGWAIRVVGCADAQQVFKTKKEALKQARRESFLKGAMLTIYKKDGSIEKQVRSNRSDTV